MSKNQTLFQKLISENLISSQTKQTARHSMWLKIVIMLGTVFLCGFLFFFHPEQKIEGAARHNLAVGTVWSGSTLIADFTFPIYKSNTKYAEEQQHARESASLVFVLDNSKESVLLDKVFEILDSLKNITKESNKSLSDPLSDRSLNQILRVPSNQRPAKIATLRREVGSFIEKTYRNGLIDINLDKISSADIIVRIPPNREYPLLKSGLSDRGTFASKLKSFADKELPDFSSLIFEIVSRYSQPNLIYSNDLTENARLIAEKSVPKTSGIVRKNEVIINKGESLTDDAISKIRSYWTSNQLRDEGSHSILSIIGNFGHSAIVYSMLMLYLFFIRKRIFEDNFQILVLSASLIAVSLAAWVTVEVPSSLPIECLIFLPALSMLAAIIFDSRTAFYATVTMSLMVAGIRGNDYITGTAMLFAGILAAYTVRDIQSRTQMFRTIFYIFIGLSFAMTIFGLELSLDLEAIALRLLLSLINATLAPVITFGALFLIERISNLATDLRIKEYDNLNHPLLVKMNEAAPGTYQHTLGVALLAERSAQAIGANPLLSKVGAYFHDIGKIAKAEYFTENQLEIGNKHDLLPPNRSALAIKDHVSDGIKIAKQYKLPQRLVDFIPMHHGTSLIRHFYAKALEEAQGTDSVVSEEDYRYPGPKPNSKETAILMICDAAEAISRVKDLDKDSIKEKISQSITEKVLDGQFDNSNLTFEEVRIIKDTIFKTIVAKSHQRVSYKEIPKIEENK